MAADGGDAGEGSFVELLLAEVRGPEGVDGSAAAMLVDMAKAKDDDTVADSLAALVEAGAPDKAAALLRRAYAKGPGGAASGSGGSNGVPSDAGGGQASALDYRAASRIINRLVELGSVAEAQELLKFLLVARDTDRGRGKMLDCYDVSFLLGAMVPEKGAESAGRLLFAFYSSETGGDDAAASQTLVPFILGTLLDHEQASWAVELVKQLMYTTLEEIEAGSPEYDYSVVGWCLAQMVWYGRADWAARLCLELERQQLDWYRHQDMLAAVSGWGDYSYSQTIENFMRDARRSGGWHVGGPPRH